jgi:hypothetical protein
MNIAVRDTTLTALPPGDPTYDGFEWFVENTMQVPVGAMPSDATMQIAYDQALNLVYWGLQTVPSQPTSPSIYAYAVYNLGAAFLLQLAIDNPGSTYWSDLRNQLGINSIMWGPITSAADQGTSESTYVLDVFRHMTLMDLQLMKSPWGRAYLMFVGQWGSLWGLTI